MITREERAEIRETFRFMSAGLYAGDVVGDICNLAKQVGPLLNALDEMEHELDEYHQRADFDSHMRGKAEARAEKAEATCAAMREAIKASLESPYSHTHPKAAHERSVAMMEAALATDAGSAMLARHTEEVAGLRVKMKRVRTEVRDVQRGESMMHHCNMAITVLDAALGDPDDET